MKIHEMEFRYFNECQNLYIKADVEIPKFDKVIDLNKTTHLHYGINEHGIVNFGLWRDEEHKRPGHGGFWSSREGVVGPLIGEELVHVGINGYGVSMIKHRLEEILPEEYYIESKKSGNEIYYEIQGGDKTKYNGRQIYPGYQLG